MFDAFREEQIGEKKISVWGQASSSFTTRKKDDIFALRCKTLYPYYKTKVGMVTVLRNDVPLAAPWDKFYKADFLKKNNLKFTEELKVLDDMFFNYQAFSAAGKVTYYPDPLYHYCIWSDSITNCYNSQRPQRDQKAFEYLQKEIVLSDLDNMREPCVKQAFYARVIKSFAICCRLYFFNENNPNSHKERLREVKKYMKMDVYNNAFKRVRFGVIEWKLWLVTIAGRIKSPRMLYLLHSLQNRKGK